MSDLRVAVLGVGVMGAYHAEALADRIAHARVTVVSDADTARAERVAKAVDARVEPDPFAAINAGDVDAVRTGERTPVRLGERPASFAR